jgi:hypothetical protein
MASSRGAARALGALLQRGRACTAFSAAVPLTAIWGGLHGPAGQLSASSAAVAAAWPAQHRRFSSAPPSPPSQAEIDKEVGDSRVI